MEGTPPEITYRTLLSLLERMESMGKSSDEYVLDLKRCYQCNGRERVCNVSPPVREFRKCFSLVVRVQLFLVDTQTAAK